MKLIYDFTELPELKIFLHTCNGIAHTFNRVDDSPAYIYTVFNGENSIVTYASTSPYNLFEI